MITITVEANSASELQSLIKSLANLFDAPLAPSTNGVADKKKPVEEKTTVEEKAPEKITIERVREVVQPKAQAGKKEEIKALLAEFGVKNVTGLAQEQYADFISKVQTL